MMKRFQFGWLAGGVKLEGWEVRSGGCKRVTRNDEAIPIRMAGAGDGWSRCAEWRWKCFCCSEGAGSRESASATAAACSVAATERESSASEPRGASAESADKSSHGTSATRAESRCESSTVGNGRTAREQL